MIATSQRGSVYSDNNEFSRRRSAGMTGYTVQKLKGGYHGNTDTRTTGRRGWFGDRQ